MASLSYYGDHQCSPVDEGAELGLGTVTLDVRLPRAAQCRGQRRVVR